MSDKIKFMRLFKSLCLVLLLCPGFCMAGLDSLENARLLRLRDGLPFFFRKIEAKQPVNIGYLGGSITEAAQGWRDQSLGWLQKQYPQVKFTGINAGVGGTGSDLGVFRVQSQVLDQQPDLVFVEFAVNDNGKNTEQIYKAMEGIVRKTWLHNPQTDICFVYTLTADMAVFFQSGKLPASALAMEQIAAHYGVPSVCLGLKVADLAKEGKLIFKGKQQDYPDKIVFSADNVHPYPETGHLLYTQALSEALDKMAANKSRIKKHRIPAPYRSDNWQQARMIPVSELSRHGEWKELTAPTDTVASLLKRRFSGLIKSTQPGDYLEVKMKGQICGLYDVIGPGCGQYSVELDNEEKQIVSRFDAYSTYYRASFFTVPVSPESIHTVRFKVSSQRPDKQAILKIRNQVMDIPSRFEEHACYAGQLLLVGELLR
jgi:lysophospholipase L1-like esterase